MRIYDRTYEYNYYFQLKYNHHSHKGMRDGFIVAYCTFILLVDNFYRKINNARNTEELIYYVILIWVDGFTCYC